MTAWWTSLTAAQHLFYLIAIASTAVLAIQLFLNLVGLAGHDVDTTFASDADAVGAHDGLDAHSTGLGLLSVRTVVAFFVGFGWAGVVLLNHGQALFLAVLLAAVAGVLCMLLVFYLMRSILKLAETGNVNVENAVGQTGTVYIPIPSAGKGRGQIQVKVQGRLREVAAVTDAAEDLPTGTPVQVVKMAGDSTMIVRKLEIKQ
jgi:membrane protein implicated in regulation of membrane protease activity